MKYLADHVVEGIPLDLVIRIQKIERLLKGEYEVGVIKIVAHIPSVGTELFPLHHDSVEKTEPVEQFFSPDGFVAAFQNVKVLVWNIPHHAIFEAYGLFISDFDPLLEDADGKLFERNQGQPKSEVLVQVGVKFFEFLLEGRHEAYA